MATPQLVYCIIEEDWHPFGIWEGKKTPHHYFMLITLSMYPWNAGIMLRLFYFQFQDVYEGHSEQGAYAAGYPDYQRSVSYEYSHGGQPVPSQHGFYDQAEYSG